MLRTKFGIMRLFCASTIKFVIKEQELFFDRSSYKKKKVLVIHVLQK